MRPFSPAEEREAFVSLAAARVAADVRRVAELRALIAAHNVGLVRAIANRHLGSHGLDAEDLAQEGSIGLLVSIDRFEVERGVRFSTYATSWIRHYVGRAIADRGSLVRVPVHAHDARGRARRIAAGERARTGAQLDVEELARRAGVAPSVLERSAARATSLDAPLDEDGATRLDTLAIDEPSPEQIAIAAELAVEVRRALAMVSNERARGVLRAHYGLDGAEPKTLEAIGASLGVTRERARQIEAEAIAELRDEIDPELAPEIGA